MREHLYKFRLASLFVGCLTTLAGSAILLSDHIPKALVADAAPALIYKLALRDIAPPEPVTPSGRSIIADLDAMELLLVEDGKEVDRMSIASRGRVGTAWETPTGTYDVKVKETEHFSSIGGVWMPWSMQFYGNFFIHGWPTHTDGTEVPEGYSGGCIRLRTPDAKRVYEFARKGTPVIIRGAPATPAEPYKFHYYLRGGGPIPNVAAGALLVADMKNGNVLWERNASSSVPLGKASVLMTGLTALETVNQYKNVRMSELLIGKGVLRKHKTDAPDELPIGALIYPLIFSANETAALAFAREHGTREFVARMNEKAKAIGMQETHFVDPGPSRENTGSAHDLYAFLRAVDDRKRFLLDVSLAPEEVLVDKDGNKRFNWTNENPWVKGGDVRYRGGLLASSTGGGGVFVGIMSLPVGEFSERDIAIVLLDDPDPQVSVQKVRSFITEHFYWGPEQEEVFVPEEDDSVYSTLRDLLNIGELKRGLYDAAVRAAML